MIGERLKEKQAKVLASQLVESEAVEELCRVIATMEAAQLEAVADLHDELDVEMIDSVPDVEDRTEQLQLLLQGLMGGDLEDVYLEEIDLPAEEVEPYLGMDIGEWEAQIEEWANHYRSQAPEAAEGRSDGDLARQHVKHKWGVELATFERRIVEFDPAETAELLFTGNMKTVQEGIERATAEVSDGEESGDAE